MNKKARFPAIFTSLLITCLLLVGTVQSSSVQTSQTLGTVATTTSTYIIDNNSTHFWVNDALWLSTNATYTIQSAFDNLPEQGGKVFLKAGVYPVDGIYITNKESFDDAPYQQIIFEGEGRQVATLKLNDNATGVSSKLESFPDYANKAVVWCEPYALTAAIRVTVTNIGIDGNRRNQQSEIAGIAIYNDWDSVIENNHLFECGGHGIMHLGSRWLRSAYITGNYVYFTDMAGQNPANPTSPTECYLSGILSWRCDVVIRENTVGWTGYRGEDAFLGIGISASFALVEDNWAWGNYIGVLIANGQFFSVSNNFIENNVNGIYLWNAHCGTITSNNVRISCNPDTGIKIGGNSSYNSIKINKIWVRDNLTAQYGIREMDSADYNTICENDIIANNKTFVSVGTSNTVGNILTPISTTGANTIASNNNIYEEVANTPATPTPTTSPTTTPTETPLTATPTATPTDQNSPSPTATSAIPEYTPWTLLAVLLATSAVPILARKKSHPK